VWVKRFELDMDLKISHVSYMRKLICIPTTNEQAILEALRVHLLTPDLLPRAQALLGEHHYLGRVKPVGERLFYVAEALGQWRALFCWNAAAKHLKHRDAWIGWTWQQRRRRLTMVANNSRYLILPGISCPNLASRALRLCLDRLSEDWQRRYGHPILLVETFVDPAYFRGTTYTAAGWKELGMTGGFGRCSRDYYVSHDAPKRLFARELHRHARRTLSTEHLPAHLASVEEKVPPSCTRSTKQLRSLCTHFTRVPEFRGRIESYPLCSLLSIIACAHFCGAPRGHRDLAAFARRLTQAQRRSLRIRRNKNAHYPAPSKATFGRVLRSVDPVKVESAILSFQTQVRGAAPRQEVIAIDGKNVRASRGSQLVTATSARSQHYLGSELVEEKSNEIPAARKLLKRMDIEGRFVSLDALHTQDETARTVVLEGGGDYLLTVKDNQPTLRTTLQNLLPPQPAAFPPSVLHTGSQASALGTNA